MSVYVSHREQFRALRAETGYAIDSSLKARLDPAMPAGWTPYWFRHNPMRHRFSWPASRCMW